MAKSTKIERETLTPREQNIRLALLMLKKAGVTHDEAVTLVCRAMKRQYEAEGWRTSEYAMDASEWTAQARQVWS